MQTFEFLQWNSIPGDKNISIKIVKRTTVVNSKKTVWAL